MRLGFIGLGKMGSRMVEKLATSSHDILVWNRSPEPIAALRETLEKKNLEGHLLPAQTIEDLLNNLQSPRIIWTMLPAGDVTESVLQEVAKYGQRGDILIDGGNAHYTDTERRFVQFGTIGIKFLGIGVSGGLIAATNGYPLMAGGNKEAYDTIVPILDDLSKPNGGHAFFGEGGAGHYVKMVHNGIEYGAMQAMGEGFGVLEKSPYELNFLDVAKLWQKGTIISGFLMDRAKEALENDQKLSSVKGIIATSGEGEWTVEEAKKEGVSVPVIQASLDFRKQSQTDTSIQDTVAAKMVAALRNAFGGHEIVKKS